MSEKETILSLLEREYRGMKTALEYSTPFQLLLATMLSAQSTDRQVNRLTRNLFKKYPTPQVISGLSADALAAEIKGCGLYRVKAKNILKAAKILIDQYGGEVPRDRDSLLTLPGVGRKTANVVLANAFGIPALGVDTHVLRVSNRLGLVDTKNPSQAEEQLIKTIPREKWADAHHWLIWHGRKICKAKNPACKDCFLSDYCPEARSDSNLLGRRQD